MSRCLDPQTFPEKDFRGSKYLLKRYLGDFGRLRNVHPDFEKNQEVPEALKKKNPRA